eukprot:TRINITY_DN35400_c0_g1_i1.p1 TRINITY_DN35400_c0_g1~~TRINITY_DN35400_c0_g1_i1.p1  ORF type:complete len:383 (+),score=60.00 TRINITY_DN35400_c0_g1_i1:41-1150(+)
MASCTAGASAAIALRRQVSSAAKVAAVDGPALTSSPRRFGVLPFTPQYKLVALSEPVSAWREGRMGDSFRGAFRQRRGFAATLETTAPITGAKSAVQPPATILVDGKRSVEPLRAELALKVAAHAGGAEMVTAGRQGVSVALRAAALARRADGRPLVFTLASIGSAELESAGLDPIEAVSEAEGSASGRNRLGFRFAFPQMKGDDVNVSAVDVAATAMKDPALISKVLRVGGNTTHLPLAKAIATTASRLPVGGAAVVETLLTGRPKNVWTRIQRLAEAVAQAHQWQVAPATPALAARPFFCAAEVRTSDEYVRAPQAAPASTAATEAVDKPTSDTPAVTARAEVLRILLLPEGSPRVGTPILRASKEA